MTKFRGVNLGKARTGEHLMMQYGGAIFNDRCRCGRKLKMPDSISVNRFMSNFRRHRPQVIDAECSRCGRSQAQFERFEAVE